MPIPKHRLIIPEKIPEKLADYSRVFETFGVVFPRKTSVNVVAEACPWCGKDRFFLNTGTGQYSCKKCPAKGNVTTYLTWVHGEFLKATTPEHYAELRTKRGIAPQTLRSSELAYDEAGRQWLIPFKNGKGTVANIQLYHPDRTTKPNKFNLPGLDLSLFGFDRLGADKGRIIFLCEGPFDAIALDYHLRQNRHKYAILATPGTFKEVWAEHFRGRKVRVLFDNDKAGRDQGERVQKFLGKTGVASEVTVLKWPDGFPDGYDLNDLIRDPKYDGLNVVGWALKNSYKVVAQPKLDVEFGWQRVVTEPEVIDWPWPHRLRCGTYASFSGRRGTMKSTIARELTARYTRGQAMPECEKPGMPPGMVIYVTAEDSKGTVWDNLKVSGADEDHVIVMPATLKDGDPMNLLDHLAELRQLIREHGVRLVIVDGQNSVVGAPNISTDMLARHNVTNKLHQFAQKENICLVGIRNEDSEGRALGPQSMGDLARCILRAVELPSSEGERYFQLVFERISDAAPKTHPPIPYAVADLGGSSRQILWGKVRPRDQDVLKANLKKSQTAAPVGGAKR